MPPWHFGISWYIHHLFFRCSPRPLWDTWYIHKFLFSCPLGLLRHLVHIYNSYLLHVSDPLLGYKYFPFLYSYLHGPLIGIHDIYYIFLFNISPSQPTFGHLKHSTVSLIISVKLILHLTWARRIQSYFTWKNNNLVEKLWNILFWLCWWMSLKAAVVNYENCPCYCTCRSQSTNNHLFSPLNI